MSRIVQKAVIPVAGLGTRFLPATKAQPKEMLPLIDTPVIHHVIQEVLDSGITEILLVTGRGKRAIEDYFDRSIELEQTLEQSKKHDLLTLVQDIANLADIHFIRQKQPLGLGHAVLQAKAFVNNEPFAVLLADEMYAGSVPGLKQVLDAYARTGLSAFGVMQVEPEEVSRYGIADLEPMGADLFRINDVVEKPPREQAPSNFAIMGRYVLEPEIFAYLERAAPGVNGEIQLTDAMRLLVGSRGMAATRMTGVRHDVGDKFGYLKAIIETALAREDLREPLLAFLAEIRRRESRAAAQP